MICRVLPACGVGSWRSFECLRVEISVTPDPVFPSKSVHRRHPSRQWRSLASRFFGYDLFISFALGPPPRGTQSYASDLARQLRERDFTVFYSEDEVAFGDDLNDTLRTALKRSRVLVVIASAGTLQRPGWVKTEVEEFRKCHPKRPVAVISIEKALQDPALVESTSTWLPVGENVWGDDSADAVEQGIAGKTVVDRLALAPSHLRTTNLWRAMMVVGSAVLFGLTIAAVVSERKAQEEAYNARVAEQKAVRAEKKAYAELRNSTGLRLQVESTAMFAGLRPEPDERAMQQLLASLRLAPAEQPPTPEAEGDLLGGLRHTRNLVRLVPAGAPVMQLAVSPGGDRLVTSDNDSHLQFWNALNGKPLGAPLKAHQQAVLALAFSPDGRTVLSGSEDTTARLWDVSENELRPALASPFTGGHTAALRSVAFSPDGQQVATGSDDGTAILWDVRTSEMAHLPLTGHADSVTGVAFSADGRLLVTASNDRSLRLWDAHSGKALGQALTGGHVDSVRCVAISPDGRRIVSGGWDNTLVLWDVATRRVLARRPDAHAKVIRSVAFSADGALIVSSSDDRSVRLWDARTGEPVGESLRGHKLPVRSAVFSREDANPRVISGSLDGSLRIWNPRLSSAVETAQGGPVGAFVSVATSPDGRNVVASGADLRLHLWSSGPGGGTTRILPGKPARVVSLAYAADGSRVAGGDWDGRLHQWDGRTGEPVGEAIDIFEKSPTADGKPVEPNEKPISALAYSPDGKRIASGGWDKKLRIWDAQSGAALTPPLSGHSGWITAVAFSPDGRMLISASADRTLRRWDAASGNAIGGRLAGHDDWVLAVAFSPDGTKIISGSADGDLRRWNAHNGQPIGEAMTGHEKWVSAVAFSPDGRHVLSGSWDKTLRIWNAHSGLPVGTPLDGHADTISSVAFSPNGREMFSISRDGALRHWAAPLRWTDMMCAKLTRNMSLSQWRNWVSPDIDYIEQCPKLPVPSG